MKTITVIFVGLIIHANQPWTWTNTAVLPYADGHKVQLIIPKDAVNGTNDPEWLEKQFNEHDRKYVIDLHGLDVRLRGTRGGWTRRTASFTASVPSMRELAPKCGKMRPEVRRRQQVEEHLESFFDYRGGTLAPRTYLKNKIKFEGTSWANGRCAVCEMEYSNYLRGDEARLEISGTPDGKEKTIRIAANSELTVSNLAPGEYHFKHHYEIFKTCAYIKEARKGSKCGKPLCEITTSTYGDGEGVPGEDCTNSQWP